MSLAAVSGEERNADGLRSECKQHTRASSASNIRSSMTLSLQASPISVRYASITAFFKSTASRPILSGMWLTVTRDMSNKMGSHWGKFKKMGGDYKEGMEKKRQMMQEMMDSYQEKLVELMEQFKGQSDSYVKIGQEALDYVNKKIEEYDQTTPVSDRIEEFQTMFEDFMQKANETFQEVLDKAQEGIEDPEVAKRIAELEAYRDAFMTKTQEGVVMMREYINKNFRTAEDRQAFFQEISKMLEVYQKQVEEMIAKYRNESGDMFEGIMQTITEQLEKQEITVPEEYKETMEKMKGKAKEMMTKFMGKFQKYMKSMEQKDGETEPKPEMRRPIRRHKLRKVPKFEGKGDN